MTSTISVTGCQAVARTIVGLYRDNKDEQAEGAFQALMSLEMASGLDYDTAIHEVDRLQAEARLALAGAA